MIVIIIIVIIIIIVYEASRQSIIRPIGTFVAIIPESTHWFWELYCIYFMKKKKNGNLRDNTVG